MFGKGKIVHHLENIHNDFESLEFANYVRQLTYNCKDKKVLKLIDKHLKRYQKICKKDVLKRREEFVLLTENMLNAISLGGISNQKELINLLESSSYYLDIIDSRFVNDLYPDNKNIYIKNDYNATLRNIPQNKQYPSLFISDYHTRKVK